MPLPNPERTARWTAQARARHLARRDAHRRSGGDPQQFREIMRGHHAAGYLYPYEHEDEQRPGYVPPSVIWRDCARQAAKWGAVYAVLIALVVASDQLPRFLYLTLEG